MIDTVDLLPSVSGLVAHFARRGGGVSDGPFSSLNLGVSSGDERERVLENRSLLAQALDVPLGQWIVGGQVHGARVVRADRSDAGDGALGPSQRFPDADGVLLAEPGVFALALSADCPLVVLADPKRRVAGIAHAGWRGTVEGVVQNLLDAMVAEGCRPEELVASVSPGICGECYEVGAEVFTALGPEDACVGRRGTTAPDAGGGEAASAHDVLGGLLDLRAVHRAILLRRGVADSAIRVSLDCSRCDADHYFSYRRDQGRTGRNGALVGWQGG